MRAEFKILTVTTDIRDKSIHILASHDIARRTVDASRVIVCEKEHPETVLDYESIQVKRSEITLVLKEWPQPNTPYVITIKDITNIVDEMLLHVFTQTILFKTDVTETVSFKAPVYLANVTSPFNLDFQAFNPTIGETITTPFVMDETHPSGKFKLGYMIEVAADPVFNQILLSFYSTQNTHSLNLDYEGQVFVRVRVQKTSPDVETMHYGYWCVHSFYHTCATHQATPPESEAPIYEPDFEVCFVKSPSYNYDVAAMPYFTFKLNTLILNQSTYEQAHVVRLPHHTEERFEVETPQDSFYLRTPFENAESLQIYINGRRLAQNSGYHLLEDHHTVQFDTPITANNIVLFFYKVAQSSATSQVTTQHDFSEHEEINYQEESFLTTESQSDFCLTKGFNSQRSYMEVYLNGRRLAAMQDYHLEEDGHTVHFDTPVPANNVVLFFYQTIQAKTALLLDNYHVSVTNFEKEIPITRVLTEGQSITLYFSEDVLQNNSVYTVNFENLITAHGVFTPAPITVYTQADTFYSDILSVQNLLPAAVEENVIFASLVNASKLTDYYAKIKLTSSLKNKKYYEQVPEAEAVEKEQLTKYLAAKDCLLKLKARVAGFGGTGMKATLGEITLDLDLSAELIDGLLNDYNALIDKWKDALQGYKDFVADSATVVKSTWVGVHWRDYSHNPATRTRLDFIHTVPSHLRPY